MYVGREILELILYRFYMHTYAHTAKYQGQASKRVAKGQMSWYSLYNSDGYLYVLFPQSHTKAPSI